MDHFVAGCETLITNRKPVGAFIEAIGIGDLFMFVRHFILFHFASMAPTANIRVPLFVPLFRWFSGHSRAPGDTEGHKESASLLDVYDFLRKFESFQIACEASALPLSQAGDLFYRTTMIPQSSAFPKTYASRPVFPVFPPFPSFPQKRPRIGQRFDLLISRYTATETVLAV